MCVSTFSSQKANLAEKSVLKISVRFFLAFEYIIDARGFSEISTSLM